MFWASRAIPQWDLDVYIETWKSIADDLEQQIKARRASALMVKTSGHRYVGVEHRDLPRHIKCEVQPPSPIKP